MQPPTDALPALGQAVLLIGVVPPTPEPTGDGTVETVNTLAMQELVRRVRPAVSGPQIPGWWRHPANVPGGITLWETAATTDDARISRRMVAVAPEPAENDLYRWVWTSGIPDLAPFARYLMHTARLRHQLRVFGDGREFRAIHSEVDAAVSNLLRLHLANPPVSDIAVLTGARARLAEVQAGTAGLVAVSTRLREIARTVEIANANVAALTARAGLPDGPPGLFGDDRDLAEWLIDRLGDEQLYLDAARERAREVAEVTGVLLDQRFDERLEDSRRRQDRMTLLQTSVLGALLMALGAIQALGYQLRVVPGSARPPLISLLAALALALPFWAFRLDPRIEGGAPIGVTDHALIGAVGATAGWLAIAWAGSGHPHPPGSAWTALAAVGGAAVTAAITRLVVFLRRDDR
ncbi:CATRA conflict system CASPASE/TPR repeat-associated protein [Frankia umida]|uniref:CATRA conflict system CASPASE/TPR repeat-associated protein n=1 Tax=Frankia umida TaxID=573489 RepID=UPI0024B0B566|nr:CATRA conflict system CASPASE/TPR repeat-associated protein [Frankia umida]